MANISTSFAKARKRAEHKSFQMVQRYAHLAPDFQERAIAALNAYGTVSAQSA